MSEPRPFMRGCTLTTRSPLAACWTGWVLFALVAADAGSVSAQHVGPPHIATEVSLQRIQHPSILGKVLEVGDRELVFLPAPYWGVEPHDVDLADVTGVKVRDPGGSGRAMYRSFMAGFLLTGLLAGASAQYNEDYQVGLKASLVTGAMVGLLGGLVGSATSTRTYPLRDATMERKQALLQELMAQPSPEDERGSP